MTKSCITSLMLFAGLLSCPMTNANEAAVRKTLAEYVDVFNRKESDKIGSFWTENGTHTDRETGERTEGREAIQADMAEVFKTQSDLKLSAKIDRFRMITQDVACVDGESTVVLSDAEPILSAFTAILVHSGDKWLLDSIEEMPLPQPVSAADALKDLEWLIGDWVDDAGDAKVSMTIRWTASQAFLLRSYSVETQDAVAMTGTQVIGWDPRGLQIRSWSFNSDGSFGESTWSRNGNSWLSKSAQTLATGDVASGTYVIELVDENSFTMQLIGHEVNGEPQAAGDVVKIVRATPSPASESTPAN